MKSFLAAILMLCGTAMTMAQTNYVDDKGNQYTFKKHGFLTLQGGAQYTLGEAKFGDLISPNVQLGIGYQFNPWFGTRIQANGWQSMGGFNGINEVGAPAAINTTYKWKYVAPGLDFMFNLSNAIAGWNPNRVFNLTAFLGAGANVGWDNGEANAMAKANQMRHNWDGTKVLPFGRGGLEFAFRLSDAVRFVIEANANILSDKYNSKKADNPDWYFNALAGLRINLGKTYTKTEPTPEPEPQPVVEPAKPYVAPAPKPAPEVVKVEPIRRDVFFKINRYAITKDHQVKIDEVVEYLKNNPNAKVSVTGYADAGTGNDRINDRLAAQRAASVVKALQDKGIESSRISSDSKGARVQPFAENDLNRVSIIIAE